jgi:hypothetical protein
MDCPSILAETVTPPIFSPEADFTVPVSKAPFGAAGRAFEQNANPTSAIAVTANCHNPREVFIAPPAKTFENALT